MSVRSFVCALLFGLAALQPGAFAMDSEGDSEDARGPKRRRLTAKSKEWVPVSSAPVVQDPPSVVAPIACAASHTQSAAQGEAPDQATTAASPHEVFGTEQDTEMWFNDLEALRTFLQSEQSVTRAQTQQKTLMIASDVAKALMGEAQGTLGTLKALMQSRLLEVLFDIEYPTVQDLDSLGALEIFPAEVICSADVTTKLLKPVHEQLRKRLKTCVANKRCALHLKLQNPSTAEMDVLSPLPFSCEVVLTDLSIENAQHLERLKTMEALFVRKCDRITNADGFGNLPQLSELTFIACNAMQTACLGVPLQNLTTLRFTMCDFLMTLDISVLVNLCSLALEHCKAFEALYTGQNAHVKHLIIESCESMGPLHGAAFPNLETLILRSFKQKEARTLEGFLKLNDIQLEEQACDRLFIKNMPQLAYAKIAGCYTLREFFLNGTPVLKTLNVEQSGVRDTFTIHANVPSLSEFVAVDCDVRCFNAGCYPNLKTFKNIDNTGKVCTINFQPKASV
ncbi:MAG: hypothetical protein V6Z78_01155 [Holosporaceae bacterium]